MTVVSREIPQWTEKEKDCADTHGLTLPSQRLPTTIYDHNSEEKVRAWKKCTGETTGYTGGKPIGNTGLSLRDLLIMAVIGYGLYYYFYQ